MVFFGNFAQNFISFFVDISILIVLALCGKILLLATKFAKKKEEITMETSIKILIADENSQTRHSTKEALSRKGFRNIEEAINGEDALIRINRSHPDIVIADLWLSKLAQCQN